jgi:hypothetical protein
MTLILKGTDNSVSDPAVQGGTGGATTGVYYPAANQVALATNGTLAFLVDASQNIGLGITPSAADSAYGQKVMQFGPVGSIASISASSTNNQTQISSNLTNPLGASPKYINSDAASALKLANGGFYFYSAAAGTAGAGAGFTTTLTMGLASQTIALQGASPASGIGITFPATQTASSNANTLDDYEEGTWTPSLGGTGSNPTGTAGGTNVGHYVKVGRAVHIRANITFSAITGGSGDARIGGFPFASTEYWTAFAMGYRGGSTAVQPQASMIENGATHAKFWTSASTSNPQTGVDATVTVTNMGSSIDWYIEGTYFTS